MRTAIAALILGIGLMLMGAVGAHAQVAPPAPAGQSAGGAPLPTSAQFYVLGPDDIIEVDVLGRADFKVRTKIGQDGAIKLPFIDSIAAANKTVGQLSLDVSKALEAGGYFAHPIVNVEVVSYASRYVIVLGSVGTPGLVPVDRPYRLSEIIARVGGIRPEGADYVVLRPENGPERRLSITSLATGDASQDPVVTPGDKIFSPMAEVFYVSGQVKTPGAYPVLAGMTLRMAIAKGGGLTDIGSDRGVKVTHKGGKVEKLDLDGKITPGDVIVIGERLF